VTGTAPVVTPSVTDGRSATLSWSSVFSDNGQGISSYFAAVYEGGARPDCNVTGVENGRPVLAVDPQSSRFKQTSDGQVSFSGLTPGVDYSFMVYAYNGQGCTPSGVVTATPRQAPSTPTDATFSAGPVDGSNGLWDFALTGLSYTPGSGGGSTVVTYRIDGDNGVSETGQLAGTTGILTGSSGNHYGTGLTFTVLSVCEQYGGGTQICNSDSDPKFSKRITGVAVSTLLGNTHYDAPSNIFTWTSWPTGSYAAVTYSCDGVTETPMPAPGQTASCAATQASPVLRVTVVANGTTYVRNYASGDFG
jgi:hypothetical protein